LRRAECRNRSSANLPTNPLALPYLTTVPRVLVDQNRQVVSSAELPSHSRRLGGGTIGPLPAGSFVVLSASSKIATGQGNAGVLKAVPRQLSANVGVPLTDTTSSLPMKQRRS